MAPTTSQHHPSGDTVDPSIVIAVIAALLAPEAMRFGIMVSMEKARHVRMPPFLKFGYGVTVADGTILPPPAENQSFSLDERIFASARIDMAGVAGESTEEKLDLVLQQLHRITAEGWRLEIGRKVTAALDRSIAAMHAAPDELPADIDDGAPDGRGVLIGVVDFGCDFAHPAFRTPDQRSRLQMLWDQNAAGNHGTSRLGLPGRFFSAGDIDKALEKPDPYTSLHYHPTQKQNLYTPSTAIAGEPAHGTHVLGVAGGRGIAGCPAGVAPGADLAFVQLQPGALVGDGDTVDVFDAVCSIFELATSRDQPAVVNLSIGANSGPHDGSTIFDRALDAVLQKPGRAITVAAGNAREERLHAMHVVTPGAPAVLNWRFTKGDPTLSVLRIFCTAETGRPPVRCVIVDPHTRRTDLGEGRHNRLDIIGDPDNRQRLGLAYTGLASPVGVNPLQHIEIRLAPTSGSGETWQIELSLAGSHHPEITVQAWIERHDRYPHVQSMFVSDDEAAAEGCSLGSTACGHRTICVGAYDPTAPDMAAASFSSAGPTRDGRTKPDVAAPGINVRAAFALGGRLSAESGMVHRNPLRGRMTGTSVAAPHVAGVVALMLQVNKALRSDDILHGLRSTTQVRPPTEALLSGTGRYWLPQLGYGRVDAAEAVRWAMQCQKS
jgi:subtilisin family serine protease